MMVTRYDVHVRGECFARGCNPYPDAFESESGIWVDFNDHARIVEHLRTALADCLDVIEPLRDELRKQGKEDAANCCDEVLVYARSAQAQALGAVSVEDCAVVTVPETGTKGNTRVKALSSETSSPPVDVPWAQGQDLGMAKTGGPQPNFPAIPLKETR